MKKICFVKMDMQDSSGGARVCANLANSLQEMYEVHVVSICSKKDKPYYELHENVKYHVLMEGEGRIRTILFKAVKELRKYIKSNDIDVVLGVGVSHNPFIILATKGTKCKAITCEHQNSMNKMANDWSQNVCRYLGAKFSDYIITLTETDKEAQIKKYHLSDAKVWYIYNWIEEQLMERNPKYDESSKKIMSVLRVEPSKGSEFIIEIAKKIYKDHKDWQWHVFGDGEQEYFKDYSRRIKEAGLQDFLILKGRVSNVYDYYPNYAIFVLTSYSEGLSMVLLEAKANKIPLISFDSLTGPNEIIEDGVNGYLVAVGDVDGVVEKIEICISSSEHRKKLSEQSYSNIEKFRKKNVLEKWIKFLNSCC